MVFGFDNGGQTCNVFWSYVPLLCRAIQEGKRYYIPIHERNLRDYPRLLNCKWLIFPFHNKLFLKLFGDRRSRSLAIHCFNNPFCNYKNLCIKFPKHFVNGYELRNTSIPEIVKPTIRELFIPNESICRGVDLQFNDKRKNYDIIVGLHIRRGDYETWKGGKFFFSHKSYATICRRIINVFQDKNVSFCIVSNEPIPLNVFDNIPFFQTPDRTSSQDLYALSKCDYIIGPPSSFSRFAAFRANVPIAFISSCDCNAFRFRKLDNFEKYETGEIVEKDF